MWTVFFLVYAAGVAGTALCVFRNRVFNKSYVVNAGAVVLWPVYWSLFVMSLFLGRSRGEPGRSLK